MATLSIIDIFIAVICFVLLHCFCNKIEVPRNWPLLGMVPDSFLHLHRTHERITEVLERSSCNFLYKGLWFANMDVLFTADPANIHYIMSKNFSNFPKGAKYLKIFDILGDGIFNSDADLWKNQRRIAQALIAHPRFYRFLVKTSQEKVEKGLIPILENVSKQRSVVDFQDLFQRFTFDVTCIMVTGYDPRCLSIEFPEVQFSKAMDEAEEVIFNRHFWPVCIWKLQRWLGVGEEQKMKRAWGILDHMLEKCISRKREELSKGPISQEDQEGVDLLTSYMTEAEIMGTKPGDKFLRDTIINLMLAGRDTTSSGLTWFLCLVAKHPKVENKIREELKTAIPADEAENWRLFKVEELNNLVYLHAAICESLRLNPPVPFLLKAPLETDTLPSGHQVNPNMKVLVSSYSLGRMTSVWGEDCLEFKPERWISESGRIKYEPSYKFLAFNAGPRACLGKEVGFIQMKTVVAAIIHNYHVQVVEGHLIAPSNSIILHMRHGLKVMVQKRWA